MPLMYHQVNLPYVTGNPRDVSINTFWTFGTGDSEDQALEMSQRLEQFYTGTTTAPGAVMDFMSPLLSTTGGPVPPTIRSYDFEDPEPRAPVLEYEMLSFAPGVGQVAEPEELALCLSFRGEYASGVPKARQRGRVYIGPLCDEALMTTEGRVYPDNIFVEALSQSASRLKDFEDPLATWVVYSRVAESFTAVSQGWIDQSWDIQRRRGIEIPSRTIWS